MGMNRNFRDVIYERPQYDDSKKCCSRRKDQMVDPWTGIHPCPRPHEATTPAGINSIKFTFVSYNFFEIKLICKFPFFLRSRLFVTSKSLNLNYIFICWKKKYFKNVKFDEFNIGTWPFWLCFSCCWCTA